MKKLITTFLLLTAFLFSSVSPLFSQNYQELYQEALIKEEGEGSLLEAIDIYNQIVEEKNADLLLQAKALLHVGFCYEKLGRDEATIAYQRLVNNYPGQKNEVALARERLSRLILLAEKISKTPLVPKFTKIEIPTKLGNGVLSPDGKMLAFTSGDSVWIVPLHGNVESNIAGEPKLLANVPGAWNFRNVLAWSGDGKWIAVNGGENGEDCAYILSISGGEPSKIQLPARSGMFNYRLSLSPDGQTLAFSAINPRVKIDKSDIHIRFLYVVSTKNGEPKLISKGSGTYPAFSLDGKHIAYISYEMRSGLKSNYSYISKLWIVESSGENPQMLATSNGFLSGPIWSPDGRFISTGKADEIFIYPLSPDLSKIEEPAIIKSNKTGFGILAGWTPNNEIGVFQRSKQHNAIYSVLASGGKAVQVTPEELWPYYPRWSPDGKHIFFRRVKPPHVIMAYVPAKGGNPVEVPVQSVRKLMSKVPGGGHNISPDGKKIVISAYQEPVDPKEGPDIWVINLDGSNPLRLTHDGLVEGYPCWSPDGQWIAFKDRHAKQKGEGYEAIYIVAATGGEIKQVTAETDIVGNGAIAFSPDGTNITFFSDGKIKNIPLEGGQQKVLVGNVKSGRHSHMAYSPDGLKVAYNIDGKIWIRKIDDGGTEELETGLSQSVQISEFSWSPNGEKIAFVASSGGELEFYLVENFLPLEKLAQKKETPKPAKEPEGITIKQIWKKPYQEDLGTVSADGRFLSYVDWEKTAGDIAIHNLITGENQILSNDATYDDPQHFAMYNLISKNGKHVAYVWWGPNRSSELRVVDVDNPTPRILYSNNQDVDPLIKYRNVYPLTWLSDNKLIIQKFNDPNYQICSINIFDGTIQVMKTPGEGWKNNILFSPDEKFITYDFANETDDGNNDINIIPMDGSSENSLVKHPANDRGFGWVPGRKEFLFISDRSGTWDLWALPLDDGKPSGSIKKVFTGIGEVEPIGFTENGKCYFGFSERNFYSYTVPFNEITGKFDEKAGKPLLGSNFGVSWSPDGQYLTYIKVGEESANPWQLTVQDLKSGEERKLANNLFLAMYPCWSTDGNSILVMGYEKDKYAPPRGIRKEGYQGAIFLVDVISGKTTEILLLSNYKYNNPTDDALPLSNIRWSSDGNSIFMLFFQDRLVKYDLETGKEETLYMQSHFDRGVLDLSPDGKNLVFAAQSPEQKKSHLYTIPVEGGEEKELCTSQEADNFEMAAWSPDGKYIYFVERGDGTNLWRIPSEGGIPEKIWQTEDRAGFSFHPDGNQIALTLFARLSEVRVIEGLIQELEKIYSKNK